MCGGVCGPRDRHRDLFADRHVPAGDACGLVRGVIGFHRSKTTAKFNRPFPLLSIVWLLNRLGVNFSPAKRFAADPLPKSDAV
jgi:hypothetical protein